MTLTLNQQLENIYIYIYINIYIYKYIYIYINIYIYNPSADDSLEELIILPPQPNKFLFLDEATLKVGQLKVKFEFSLTNVAVFNLSLNREKFNLNWETITSFINDYFKLEGNDQVLLQSFVSSNNAIKKSICIWKK